MLPYQPNRNLDAHARGSDSFLSTLRYPCVVRRNADLDSFPPLELADSRLKSFSLYRKFCECSLLVRVRLDSAARWSCMLGPETKMYLCLPHWDTLRPRRSGTGPYIRLLLPTKKDLDNSITSAPKYVYDGFHHHVGSILISIITRRSKMHAKIYSPMRLSSRALSESYFNKELNFKSTHFSLGLHAQTLESG
jgi:hypothetical protein